MKKARVMRSAEWGLALLLLVVLLLLHLQYWRQAGALWRDEVNSVEIATQSSFSAIGEALRYDSFPILMSVFLRGWSRLVGKTNDLGLRVFGLLVGMSVLAALWLNARWFRADPPLEAWILLGLSPWTLRVGDSIRPHGIAMLFVVLTFGLVFRALERFTWRRFLAATLCCTLTVHCLYQLLGFVGAVGVAAAVVSARRREWKRGLAFLGLVLVAALSLVPYVGIIRVAMEWAVVFQAPFDPRGAWAQFLHALGFPLQIQVYGWMLWVGLGLGAGLFRSLRRGLMDDARLYALSAWIVGTVGFVGFLKLPGGSIRPWYYLPLLAFWAASLAPLTSHWVGGVWGKGLRLVLAVVLAVMAIPHTILYSTLRQTNVDVIAARLNDAAQANDLILVSPWYVGITFQRYYHGAAPFLPVPPLEELRIHRYDLVMKKMIEPDPIAPLLGQLAHTLRKGGRLWLVDGYPPLPNPQDDPPPLPPAPHSEAGWNTHVYSYVWGMQLNHYIQNHAAESELVVDPTGSSFESVFLYRFQGWHEP